MIDWVLIAGVCAQLLYELVFAGDVTQSTDCHLGHGLKQHTVRCRSLYVQCDQG